MAEECKKKIKNPNKQRERYTIPLTVNYFNHLVSQIKKGKYNQKKLPSRNYELLICVTDLFFKKLETGHLNSARYFF